MIKWGIQLMVEQRKLEYNAAVLLMSTLIPRSRITEYLFRSQLKHRFFNFLIKHLYKVPLLRVVQAMTPAPTKASAMAP